MPFEGYMLIAPVTALVGAAAGLYFTLTWNRKKQIEDRELALRKDVYLSFVDGFSDVSYYLSTYYFPDATIENGLAALRKFGLGVNRAHLTADKEVISAMGQLQLLVSDAWIFIQKPKAELTNLEGHHKYWSDRLEQSRKNPEIDDNEARVSLGNIEAAMEEIKTQARLWATNWAENMQKPHTEAVIALRRELRMPIDDNWYRQFRNDFWKDLFGNIKKQLKANTAPQI